MKIDAQIAAVRAAQGALAIEQVMLTETFSGPPAPTTSPGVNATKQLALASGTVVTLAQLANIAGAMRLGIEVAFVRPDGTPALSAPSAAD